MVLDWLYSPICSSGWIAREAARVFDLTLREWNLADIRDGQLVLLPMHISKTVKEIRREHKHTRINGAKPMFFLGQKPIGSHTSWGSLTKELENNGLRTLHEPNIPESFVHPRLSTNRDDLTIMVKPVSDKDIGGQGLPSPSMCIDARFGSLGSPEVQEFMTDMTRQYGRIMSIAFIGSEVAGYILHIPKPIASRIGCSHVTNVQEMKVLQIIELFVYDKFRNAGVEEVLLEHTKVFAKKTRLERIEVFTATNEPTSDSGKLIIGCSKNFAEAGFVKVKNVTEPDGTNENTENGLGISHLMLRL